MVLDQVLIQKCREAFSTFDTDKSGTIDIFEMKNLLSAIGQDPSEEEIFRFMQDIDEDRTGQIDFAEFLRVFEKEVSSTREFNNEQDTRQSLYNHIKRIYIYILYIYIYWLTAIMNIILIYITRKHLL
eukprot:GHVL01026063.1.p1 GENE.GHVL01026063.1~~GHVL01026063.1.p1  ORF type:complete len:128 (+),score=30.82 GHVL01026063.1:10-393(+)